MAYTIRKSVFIGIGGAGTSAVRSAKKTVIDIYGKLPPFIRFLAVDSDAQSEAQSLKLDPGREYLHLTVARTHEAREGQPLLKETYPKKNVKSQASKISKGCGQIRGNGRLTLLYEANYFAVKAFLREAFVEVNKASNSTEFIAADAPLDIYVVSSVAGGTGSGMLVDMAIIINNILHQDGIEYNPPTALLFLPDLYSRKAFTRNIHGNTYATLKEIEFIIDDNIQEIRYPQPDNINKIEGALFSKIGVVDNFRVASTGGVISLPDNEPAETAIGKALVVLSGSLGVGTDAVWDNAQGMLATKRCEGKQQLFSGIGICEVVVDTKKLSELLHLRSIKAIIDKTGGGKAFGIEEVLNQLKSWQVREDRKDKLDQVISRIFPMTGIMEPESLSKEELSKEMLSRLRNIRVNYINNLKAKALRDSLSAYGTVLKDFTESLTAFHIEGVHKEGGISRLVSFYEILNGYAKSCQLEMQEEIGTAANPDLRDPLNKQLERIKDRYKEIEDLISKELDSFFTSRKELAGLADEYRNVIKQELVAEVELMRRDQAHTFYLEMEKLATKNLESLNTITKRLSELKIENSSSITGLIKSYSSFNQFTLDIGEKYINNEITIPKDDVFNSFCTYLANHDLISGEGIHRWSELEPDKIKSVINAFIEASSNLIDPIKKLSIDEAFSRLTPTDKKEYVKNIKDFASPLWNPDRAPSGFNPEIIAFIGVPDAEGGALALDEKSDGEVSWVDMLKPKSGPLAKVSTHDSQRYMYLTIEAAGPAFAIGKVKTYKKKFEDKNMAIEFHSNELWKTEMEKAGYDLLPRHLDDEAITNWSLGCVFDLIKRDSSVSRNYIVKSTKGEARGIGLGYYNLKTVDRVAAFEAFCEDEVLKKDIKEQVEALWLQKGIEACHAEILEYLAYDDEKGYLKKMKLKRVTYESEAYSKVRNLMQNEIAALKKLLNQ